MEEEIWKDVPDYEGHYQVSNLGRVKCLARERIGTDGRRWNFPEVILKPQKLRGKSKNQIPYLTVGLWKDKKRRNLSIHTLVLLAFVGPPLEGMMCRHFPDSDPNNNCLSNLQWGTCKENNFDRHQHGTFLQGEKCHQSKLKNSDVYEIRRLSEINYGFTVDSLAVLFGVSEGTVKDVLKRLTWKHIE